MYQTHDKSHKQLGIYKRMLFFIIIWRDKLSKWLRWKKMILNSRLMCEYVKNKAALFALQDLFKQKYAQHKKAKKK